ENSAAVCAELSGGLDSSSVLCMADLLVKRGTVRTPQLIGLTYLQDGSRDKEFARDVEASCAIPAVHLPIQPTWFMHRDTAGVAAPLPWAPRLRDVRRLM